MTSGTKRLDNETYCQIITTTRAINSNLYLHNDVNKEYESWEYNIIYLSQKRNLNFKPYKSVEWQ